MFKLTNYQTAEEQADIIAFLVAHAQFNDLKISSEKVVLDFCGITSKDNKKLKGI